MMVLFLVEDGPNAAIDAEKLLLLPIFLLPRIVLVIT